MSFRFNGLRKLLQALDSQDFEEGWPGSGCLKISRSKHPRLPAPRGTYAPFREACPAQKTGSFARLGMESGTRMTGCGEAIRA